MIRRVTHVVVALVLMAGLLAAAATAASTPTLGTTATHGTGFGTVKPRTISYDGDGTSFVKDVTWSSWGGSEAVGAGRADWVWPGLCSACGSDALPAKVVAYDPGDCNGHDAYQYVAWYFPSRGQTFNRYLGGTNLCTGRFDNPPKYLIDPVKCGTHIVLPVQTVNNLTATDIGCAEARRTLPSLLSNKYLGENNAKYRVGAYYCGTTVDQGIGEFYTCQHGDFKTIAFELN